MTINRHNYEEYFMLYVDHELTPAERRVVEEFVHENSDLEEELVMLQQSKLKPDHSIFFENKKSLLRQSAGNGLINELNYEEFFVSYVDGELSEDEKTEVEQFIFQHPHLKLELDLLGQATLQPDLDIVFENKEVLYRNEEIPVRTIMLPWLRFSVAAAVLLLAGLLVFNNLNRTNSTRTIASGQKAGNELPTIKEKIQEPVVTPSTAQTLQDGKQNEQSGIGVKKSNRKKEVLPGAKKADESPVQEIAMEAPARTIPEASLNKNEGGIKTGSLGFRVNSGAHQTPEIIDRAVPVATEDESSRPPVQSSLAHMTEDPEGSVNILTSSSGKTKMRGFFRKVSRVFEKNTGIGDTDSKKSVLVGSFQIALK